MLKIYSVNNDLHIEGVKNLKLDMTLDCGQAFRWSSDDGIVWHGFAFGKRLELYMKNETTLVLMNTSAEEYEDIWKKYFDLERNYGEIIEKVSTNEILKSASQYGSGIRILNQEPWETLCSFIISQNNNIPRIKGIIDRLCENFGEKNGDYFTFPTAEKIATLSLDDLSILRSGFRAKYILDAAQKVASCEVNLEALKTMPLDDARNELMKIKGVGPKVADCTLLFSLEHIEAFPQDVWIKRAMEKLFDGNLPECALPFAGIVQEYIFYYARTTKLEI